MANWKEYTTKTTPEDADEIMIADSKANASKRTPFSGLWNWIAGKLATAVISQLETQNKSIIPALNELNSKTKVTAITIAGNKEYTMALEYDSIYILTYSENISDNVKAETINYAIIISRQKSGKTGGVYINNSSVEEKITLDDNILKFTASGWWVRAYIKKL